MGGKSSAPASSTTTVQNVYSPEEQAMRNRVFAAGQQAYENSLGRILSSPYPGPAPVPRDPLTSLGHALALGQAATALPSLGQGASEAAMFGLGPAMYAESNPYLQSAILGALNPALTKFTGLGGALSDIRSSAQGAGQFGGTRQGLAEGLAAGLFGQGMLDTAAKMASENYQQAADRQLKTLALLPVVAQMGLLPAQITEGVGLSNEALAQERELYNAAQRQWDLTKEWQALQPFANLVFGGIQPATQTTSTAAVPGTSPVLQGLSGAAAGAMLGSKLPIPGGPILGALGGLVLSLFGR